MAWSYLSSIYEERGISTTFVGWLLCDFNRCPKLRKFVEKKIQTMVNEPFHRRGKEVQVAKNKIFPLTSCCGRHLEGAWSVPKSLSTPSRASNWRKMRAKQWQVDSDSCRSTCSRSTLSELLHAPDIIKTTDAVLSSIPREALSAPTTDVFHTGEAGGHTSKPGSLSFSPDWASAAAAFVSSTVLHSASCRSFYGVTSLLCEAKKWEQNRRQTTMKKCYSFQKPSLDA